MEKTQTIKLETRHFTLFELADGVYAAIEKENHTGSNAGFIDLGDHTVIFDTFLNIDAARELKEASEQITGKVASYVINSHSHSDHFIGNCLYPESTTIISTAPSREAIARGKEEFRAKKDKYAPRIKEIQDSLDSGESSNVLDLRNELQFLSNFVKPGVEIRVPNLTFEKEMILYGSKRRLVLKTFDMAHSPCDIVAYLPDDKICFMGDLITNRVHPWLGSGSPEKFIEALETILNFEVDEYVPGHGGLANRNAVYAQIQCIKELIEMVNQKKSLNPEDYSVNDLSPLFKDWDNLTFSWNINFLIERMKKSDG